MDDLKAELDEFHETKEKLNEDLTNAYLDKLSVTDIEDLEYLNYRINNLQYLINEVDTDIMLTTNEIYEIEEMENIIQKNKL